MKKIVKKYGNSLVIIFNNEDQSIYNIAEGDLIELSDLVVIKRRLENENHRTKPTEQ